MPHLRFDASQLGPGVDITNKLAIDAPSMGLGRISAVIGVVVNHLSFLKGCVDANGDIAAASPRTRSAPAQRPPPQQCPSCTTA